MPEQFHIVPIERHNELIEAAYRHRGYTEEEAGQAARFSAFSSRHGIRTHNAIKALHLDRLFGSAVGGCRPNVPIEKKECRFAASEIWNANRKLGQAAASQAIDRAVELADNYGIGQVSVDNAFHYLWGGGYVMEAAKRGYVAYTHCTSSLAEVVPFLGKFPTLGTNPHSWAFPTTDAIGFPVVIDWATSVISMGRVQQFQREGKALPLDAAVDKDGKITVDANAVNALVPFGAHKGYGISLINEIVASFIGGSLPTLRSRNISTGEKNSSNFYFQVIHPDALNAGAFAKGRDQTANVRAVIEDILGHGNGNCLLPGQIEARWAKRVEKAGGLLFSAAEIEAFDEIAEECGAPRWQLSHFQSEEK